MVYVCGLVFWYVIVVDLKYKLFCVFWCIIILIILKYRLCFVDLMFNLIKKNGNGYMDKLINGFKNIILFYEYCI